MARLVDYDNEWTQLEDAQLKYLHKAGNTWIAIGQGLKRTADECLLRGLRRPTPSPAQQVARNDVSHISPKYDERN